HFRIVNSLSNWFFKKSNIQIFMLLKKCHFYIKVINTISFIWWNSFGIYNNFFWNKVGFFIQYNVLFFIINQQFIPTFFIGNNVMNILAVFSNFNANAFHGTFTVVFRNNSRKCNLLLIWCLCLQS